MADSRQLQILKALTGHLEGINPDVQDPATGMGYRFDLRSKVFRGRMILGNDIQLPALVLLESPTPVEPFFAGESGHMRRENWRLLLQGFAENDQLNPSDPAYELKAMVEQRLSRLIEIDKRTGDPVYPGEYLLGNRCSEITISQGVVRPPEQGVSATAFFYIPLVVKFEYDIRFPY